MQDSISKIVKIIDTKIDDYNDIFVHQMKKINESVSNISGSYKPIFKAKVKKDYLELLLRKGIFKHKDKETIIEVLGDNIEEVESYFFNQKIEKSTNNQLVNIEHIWKLEALQDIRASLKRFIRLLEK